MAPTTTQYRYPVRGMQQENLQPVADVNWARMIAFQRAIDSIIGGVGQHASFEEGKRRYEQGYGLQVKESERQQQLLQLQQQQEARAAQQQRFEGTARAARMVTQNPEMEPLLQGMPEAASPLEPGDRVAIRDLARSASQRRTAAETEKTYGDISQATRGLKSRTDLESTFTQIDGSVAARRISQETGDALKKRAQKAFDDWEALQKELAEAEQKSRLRLAYAQTAPTPQRFGPRDLDAALESGNMPLFNFYLKKQGAPPVDAEGFKVAQEAYQKRLSSVKARVATAEAQQDELYRLATVNPRAALARGAEYELTPEQTESAVAAGRARAEAKAAKKPMTAGEKAKVDQARELGRLLSKLIVERAKERGKKAIARYDEDIKAVRADYKELLPYLNPAEIESLTADSTLAPSARQAARVQKFGPIAEQFKKSPEAGVKQEDKTEQFLDTWEELMKRGGR